MKMSKKFLSLALAGALALGLTACQQSDPTEEQAQAYAQQVAGLDAAVEHLHVIKLRGVLNMDLRMGLHCGPYPVY